MPYFYHYTDREGALNIIKSGKIMSSLTYMTSGDTAYGNGVYLTKMNPQTSTKVQIATNNWMQASAKNINKMKNYFVFDIPNSDVQDTKAKGRNIFLFGQRNDLRLVKYSWWLKDYDSGQIIASYKYKVTSLGPASKLHSSIMGDYRMTEDTVNGRPVYKHLERSVMATSQEWIYIFMSSDGSWFVGSNTGADTGWLRQKSNNSLGPVPNTSWEYVNNGHWKIGDATLKADAWQK